MRVLTNCGKLEVRASPIEGFGVFAKDDIAAGTILEEVPFILFPRYIGLAKNIFDVLVANNWVSPKEMHMNNLSLNMGFKHPDKFFFKWHPPIQLDSDSMYTVLPLGYGPIYNSSNTANNADWKMLLDTFTFKAEKDIVKDSEIITFYGYFLGEDGSSFNCETVFHLAIDMFDSPNGKVHKVKMLRFGSLDTYQHQRNNPSAIRFNTCIAQSVDGVTIKKITAVQSNGVPVAAADIPIDMNLTALYSRLQEANSNSSPLVEFQIEYVNKTSQQKIFETITWKK